MKEPDKDIKDFLKYDPVAGSFHWIKDCGTRGRVGAEAKNYTVLGYVFIAFKKRKYSAHQLAWWWIKGAIPTNEIDHINGVKDDNRFSNLREATRGQNTRNSKTRKDSSVGLKGVSPDRGKFRGRITLNGVRIYLGTFATKEEAFEAVRAARRELHKEFANNG